MCHECSQKLLGVTNDAIVWTSKVLGERGHVATEQYEATHEMRALHVLPIE